MGPHCLVKEYYGMYRKNQFVTPGLSSFLQMRVKLNSSKVPRVIKFNITVVDYKSNIISTIIL